MLLSLPLNVTLLSLATFAIAEESHFTPIKLSKPPLQTELIEVLDKAIEEADDDANAGLFKKRARQFAYGSEWKKAAADFRRSAELSSDSNTWVLAGVTLLLAGDRMAYQQLVEDFLKQHKDNTNMYSREKRAKMCVLAKTPVGEQAVVEKWADESVKESEGTRWAPYFTATDAMVACRYGKYESAQKAIVETDRRIAMQDEPSQNVYAVNRLIEAMCLAKQGHVEKAAKSFAKADEILRVRLANTQIALTGNNWHDWMIAKLLHDEACGVLSEVVDSEPASKSDPKNGGN